MSANTVMVTVNFLSSVRSKDVAAQFFELFSSLYPELRFELMGEIPTSKRERFDRLKALEEWERDRGSRGVARADYQFEGKSPLPFYASVIWHGQGTHHTWSDSIGVQFDERFWIGDKPKNFTDRAVQLLIGLAELGSVLYGDGAHWSEFEEKNSITMRLPDGRVAREISGVRPRKGLGDIYWANLFGKPYIDLFGRENLMRVEATRMEFARDNVLLIFGSGPFDWKRTDIRNMQEKARLMLDRNAFVDKSTGLKPNLNIGGSSGAR